jgi:hypothetical protein
MTHKAIEDISKTLKDNANCILFIKDYILRFRFADISSHTKNTESYIDGKAKLDTTENIHKKYTKEHLSKLIMTGLLKQVLSIQDISVLFSGDENAEALYGDFAAAQDAALQQTVAELHGEPDEKTLRATALRLAAEANARRAVSERILMALSEKNNEEETKPKKKHKEKE